MNTRRAPLTWKGGFDMTEVQLLAQFVERAP
jgi:hypothetical protein